MEAEETSGGKKSSDSAKAKSSEALVSPTEHEIPNNEVTEQNGDRSESSASHKRRSRKDDKSQERHSDEPKHRSKSRDRERDESRRHRPKSAHRRKSDRDDEEVEGEDGHRRHSRSSSKHKERSSKDEDKERHRSKSSSRHKSESSKDGEEEERHHRSRSSSRHRRKSTKDLEKKLDEVTKESREDRSRSLHRRRSDKESSKDRESSRSRHDEDRRSRKSRTSEGRDDEEHAEDDRRRSRSRSSRRKHSDKDDAANDLAKSDESVKLRSSILKSSSKDRSHRPKSSYQRPPLTSTVASLVSANIQPEQSEKSPTTNIKEPNLSKSSIDFGADTTLNGSLELTDIEQSLDNRNLKFDFRLDDVFNEKAGSKENADPGDYETAFSQSSDALKLGPNIHFIQFLMKHFENSVRTRRIEQATEAKNQLASLLRNNVQTNANEIKRRALNLAASNQYIPAFLFFQIASFFFERELPPRKSVNEIRLCVWEIKEICRRMTEEEEEDEVSESGEQFSSLVSQLVLGMLELKDRISALKKVPPKLHAVSQAHCCYYIALCLGWDEKYGQSERYWKEAIAISERVFADKAAEHKYYGDLKSNLAYVYECQSRYGEAVLMYNQSLSCVLQATDFSSAEEKTACVGTLKEYIKDAKSMGNIN